MEKTDRKTEFLAKTIDHMQKIYPLGTLEIHKKINQNLNERTDNNPL